MQYKLTKREANSVVTRNAVWNKLCKQRINGNLGQHF